MGKKIVDRNSIESDPGLCGYYGGKRRNGEPCGRPAGWGIPNQTTGKCRVCCRYGGGRPITHGLYASRYQNEIAQSAERFMSDPDPLSMLREISIIREILDRALRGVGVDIHAPDFNPDDLPTLELDKALPLVVIIERIAKITESEQRKRNMKTLDEGARVRLLLDFIDVLGKVPEPYRSDAIAYARGKYPMLNGVSGATGEAEDDPY